jgi:tetratricopeptide (TPR) repeat protein
MKRLISITVLVLVASVLFSQEVDVSGKPAWLLLEEGKEEFRDQEFGRALRYFREALSKKQVYPEARYWIGRIFEVQSELDIALQEYRKAYENRKQLYILEEKYTLLYRMAEIHKNRKAYKQYEETLNTILEDDRIYSSPEEASFRTAIIQNLKEEGLNRLLILYRLKSDFSLTAQTRLGLYYFANHRYPRATRNFVFAVITIFSTCIEELRITDPEYVFEQADNCLQLIREDERLRGYTRDTELFFNLYGLSRSLYNEGNLRVASELEELVRKHADIDQVRENFRMQLTPLQPEEPSFSLATD